ncbi:DUF1835 domain-containing protein [Sporosarcina sp. Marseille-Q4063]|uniref:DUF1835 domain-containing protein n=1 Tax=Sporosarcina sp. Marseille-Q4063 TaxID=2810514 RepID=UPI001BB0A430|nr:DUF1835 domain-containing protein [Sporosarcina sp. Marseille-Q4063]QUW23582.1 DUF1835 domain-containing protein [Sporosarcina sp. Marseille-Q4063]
MYHLIFGNAAIGGLKHAFRKKSHKVIGFPIDFSVGPITNIHKESGITRHFDWLRSSFRTDLNGGDFDDQTAYCESLQKLLEIKDGEQVIIWTCENAAEQIGLRISYYLLKDKEVELSVVNTFTAMHEYMKHKDVQFDIRHSAECDAEQLAHFYMHSTRPISKEVKREYAQSGEKLLSSESIVRSWQHGEVIDDLATRDDPFILECAESLHNEMPELEFINAPRVIGEVLGHSTHSLSDTWIEYRLRSLINSNKLAYKGNLQSMRMYEIKVIQ